MRSLPVFGYHDQHGARRDRASTTSACRSTNLLGGEGDGFAIAQARLGPGRIHHCMRAIGMAERALRADGRARAASRDAFGRPLAEQGVVQQRIAESRMAIEQARLLVLKTAWLIDTVGAKARAHRDRRDQGGRAAGGLRRSSTTPSRCTAAPASATTPRWPRMYAGARTLRHRRRPGRGARPLRRPRRAQLSSKMITVP